MLDSLIRTDLMAFKPDVDAVDIWMDSFSIQMIVGIAKHEQGKGVI